MFMMIIQKFSMEACVMALTSLSRNLQLFFLCTL